MVAVCGVGALFILSTCFICPRIAALHIAFVQLVVSASARRLPQRLQFVIVNFLALRNAMRSSMR